MSSHAEFFEGLADVYEAGAKQVRGFVYEAGAKQVRGFVFNHDAQREAATLQAMADKAREVAQRAS